MYKDRHDAGTKLAGALSRYAGRGDATVIALPRGGVIVGRAVADALALPLDVVVTRKIGAPGHEEYAIGALTERGDAVWNETERAAYAAAELDAAVMRERREAERRLRAYRGERPPRALRGRTAIIVDDGIATGYTMLAAIRTVRSEAPASVVVAVPVAPPDSLAAVEREADAVVALMTPSDFAAVGAYYERFEQVGDDEVAEIMNEQ